jgi:hypothetical protein
MILLETVYGNFDQTRFDFTVSNFSINTAFASTWIEVANTNETVTWTEVAAPDSPSSWIEITEPSSPSSWIEITEPTPIP